jgi:Zn-dependent peptidase ImmA (M78 family)
MNWISDRKIEEKTLVRISEYEKGYGSIKIPVPLDIFIEKIFNLTIDRDSLGVGALGGLDPKKRILSINSDYDNLFKEKPGLERFTEAHELGHWDLHVDEANFSHPSLFDAKDNSELFLRKDTNKGNAIYIIKNSWLDPEIYKAIGQNLKKHDTPQIARQVEKYASFLLMPTALIQNYLKGINSNIYNWPALYKMAEEFQVTISALKIRLTQMKLIYISNNFSDKKIYHSKEEATGQGSLLNL